MYRKLHNLFAQNAGAMALNANLAAFGLRARQSTRTGGPDDDEDDQLRRLMPILASVIAIAVIFGN
jgi:hypothetical protein